MDARIDLTENRDFRDERTVLPSLGTRIHLIDEYYHICDRCGQKIVFGSLCEKCDLELDYSIRTRNLFIKEEIQSVF